MPVKRPALFTMTFRRLMRFPVWALALGMIIVILGVYIIAMCLLFGCSDSAALAMEDARKGSYIGHSIAEVEQRYGAPASVVHHGSERRAEFVLTYNPGLLGSPGLAFLEVREVNGAIVVFQVHID